MERYTHTAHIISGIIVFIAFILMVGTAGTNDTGTAFEMCRSNFILFFVIFAVNAYICIQTN